MTRKRIHSLTYIIIFAFICLATVGIMRLMRSGGGSPQTSDQSKVTVKDVYVATVSPDDPRSDITSDEYSLAKSGELEGVTVINFANLRPETKLLSIDGAYYFDDFEHGAEIIEKQVTPEEAQRYAPLPTKETTLSFAQTGVTAITRAMTTKLNAVGDGAFFAENIKDFLSTKDLTHISNEVSFADNCPGGSETTTLCSDWRALDTITAIGTDVIELTGNHNNDYGAENNITTINKYHDLGLQTFGGGVNETMAAANLILGVDDPANSSATNINTKGTKITLLGYNYSTSTKENGQGASGDHPGANIYNEEHAKADIAAAKANDTYTIVDVQFSECYCYPDEGAEMPSCDAPITGQAEFFRHLIDLGADMVVGTQAHQPQTYEIYNGKPIYYGLGNLFFDQIYWPGTTRSIILTHYFVNGTYLQTRLTPTIYDSNFQPRLMTKEESQAFLTRLLSAK